LDWRTELFELDNWTNTGIPAVAAIVVVVVIVTSAHAALHKRDVRAAAAWVGLIWLSPGFGALLYLLLGINRIHRRAVRLRERPADSSGAPDEAADAPVTALAPHLLPLKRLVGRISRFPLTTGNAVQVLRGGDEAFPEMLRAISEASTSITLCSYIFDADAAGATFTDALVAAKQRGVEVRVLVDAVGARYSWPRSILKWLRQAGVPCARFMPTVLPWRMPYANLRNHRKLLIVDGRIAFTGGMNIREGNLSTAEGGPTILDTHFRLEGPVVEHLQQCFVEDWRFTTHEVLEGERWFPALTPSGDVLLRAITDGPDEDLLRLRWVLLGALDCAKERVRIVTPYFLPDPPLIAALGAAALRGVDVQIFLPAENNLAMVQWASTATLWQVLENGCRVWLTPPPFDHSKLMVVDGAWSFFGSSNWDPRSLRLSFELDVTSYDRSLAGQIEALIDAQRERAREITLAEVDGRSLPIRLRDSIARLFTPYL
jgi:cardiolipin synthase